MGKLPPTQAGDAANGGEHGYSNPDQGMTKIASVPAQPVPLCSVSNTIVDHVSPPTPMEPPGISRGFGGAAAARKRRTRTETWTRRRSYQHKKQTASNQWHWVPVMRIFGPVLRRDDSDDDDEAYRQRRQYQTTDTVSLSLFTVPFLHVGPTATAREPDVLLHRSSHLMNTGSSSN
jgi:hypothetical protein